MPLPSELRQKKLLLALNLEIQRIHLFHTLDLLLGESVPHTVTSVVSELKGARCSSVVRAFARGAMGLPDRSFVVDQLTYFSFQTVIYDWCIKGRGMCYPVCGMIHIKEPTLAANREE